MDFRDGAEVGERGHVSLSGRRRVRTIHRGKEIQRFQLDPDIRRWRFGILVFERDDEVGWQDIRGVRVAEHIGLSLNNGLPPQTSLSPCACDVVL